MRKETQKLFKQLAQSYSSNIYYTEKFNKEKYCWTYFIRLCFMPIEMHIQIKEYLPTFEKAVHFYIKHQEEYRLSALYFPDTNKNSEIFSFPEQRELIEKIQKFYAPNSVKFIKDL